MSTTSTDTSRGRVRKEYVVDLCLSSDIAVFLRAAGAQLPLGSPCRSLSGRVPEVCCPGKGADMAMSGAIPAFFFATHIQLAGFMWTAKRTTCFDSRLLYNSHAGCGRVASLTLVFMVSVSV